MVKQDTAAVMICWLEGPGIDNHVIARGHRPVAISWYIVQILTQYQEIAAPCGLAMTEVNDRCSFCFGGCINCIYIQVSLQLLFDVFAGAKSIYGPCPFDIAPLRYDINPSRPAGHIEWIHISNAMRISKILSGIYIE